MGSNLNAVKHRGIRSDSLNEIFELLRMGTNPKDALRQRIRLWWIMSNSHVRDIVLCLWAIGRVND